jgi:hypothetical protein
MKNGSILRSSLSLLVGLAALGSVALSAAAQTPSARPANCHAYKLDEKTNQIIFNDPRITVQMLEKKERDRLRSQGTPGQVFLMKNCDSPDTEADFKVFDEPADSAADPELVPSAVRVIIVAEQGDWVQLKGHTELWKGTGWVKKSDKILIVKY